MADVLPLVILIYVGRSFNKCLWATQNALEGCMHPGGHSLPTPVIDSGVDMGVGVVKSPMNINNI